MRYAVRPVADRFWEKVSKTGAVPESRPELGPCWIWTGGINRQRGGYGMFALRKGVIRRSHRIAWELTNGPVPGTLWVLHHCDNPPCVRPDHLFLGTPKDNTQDMAAKGRDGFPGKGSAHPSSKLTGEDVRTIQIERARGVPDAELARRYGVDRSTIYRRSRSKYWDDMQMDQD